MMLKLATLGGPSSGAVMKVMAANEKMFDKTVAKKVDTQIKKAASYTKPHGKGKL
jgi:hypothetical protein